MKRLMFTLMLVMLSGQSHAAQLLVDDVFEILSVDGQVSEGSLLKHVDRIELSEGNHKIIMRYKDIADDRDLGYEAVVVSKPFSISVNTMTGVTYRIEPDISALQDKHTYANNPVVTLRTPEGERKVLINGNVSASKQRYEESAPPLRSPTGEVFSLAPINHESGEKQPQSEPGERLRHWWNKADRRTRQLFMGWIVDN